MPTQFSFDVVVDTRHRRLVAAGEIDLSNIGAFRQALTDAAADATRSGTALVVDLAAVGYLDSAAINALYAAADDIALIVAAPLLLTTLRVSGLAEVITVDTASHDPGDPTV
ncbi:STAS domain-containing protein [Mycobacterium sp. C3-094]|uniref:STAS domain-containing protein n=1 Tax=Mycobacterium sp. PSTR-4-N TaxID=2917745 RepID=UPI001F1570DC|nr:STAS domain-containing protein [Mycobacterium sp. PSTR-4-N]MCG7592613.1 STAS domain-containing protein [Mycobacterium sp. PSTR-4-N]